MDHKKYTRNTQEIHGSDSQNFETLKYNIANGSSDILLDDAYDPDLNLDMVYVSQEDVLISKHQKKKVSKSFCSV